MVSIISEQTLELLVCSNCDNYLTYGITKIGNMKTICGRCDQKECVLNFDSFDMKKYLFPCINRFDHCRALLRHYEIKEHEENCKTYTENSCSECKYKGNGCQLYHHFLREHPDNVLKWPMFRIYLLENKKCNYLYRINNNLFVVQYEVEISRNILRLAIRSIGNTSQPPQFQFVVKSLLLDGCWFNTELQHLTQEFSLERNFIDCIQKLKQHTVICHLNVKVAGELFTISHLRQDKATNTEEEENQEKTQSIMSALHKNLFPKLLCSHCACYVIPPIYKCPHNHVKCEDCNSSYCDVCEDVTNWARAEDLEAFQDIIPLPCRWSCQTVQLSSQLRSHEKSCTQRKYKCVEKWCSWSGKLRDFIEHWHSSTPMFDGGSHQVYAYEENRVEFYLLYDKEVFYFWLDALKNNERYVHVRKVSDVSFPAQKYFCSAELTYTCNGLKMRKRVSLKYGGITLLKRSYFEIRERYNENNIIFNISLLTKRNYISVNTLREKQRLS